MGDACRLYRRAATGWCPRVKISFLIANAYSIGGTVRTTFANAAELAARGHDVEIVSVYQMRRTPKLPLDERVRLRSLVDSSPEALATLGRGPRALLRRSLEARPSRLIHRRDERYERFNKWTDLQLHRHLRTVDADVIVGTRPGLNLAIARWVRPSVVRVGQEHLHLTHHRASLLRAFTILYPSLDAVVTLTSADSAAYRELLGAGVRLETIPNAATPGELKQSTCRSRVVVSAGRLTNQKGFDFLIEAYEMVAATHPTWELRIYGDGYLRDELQREIDDRNLEDRVFLEGYTNRLPAQMAKASIYAMSSRFEGFPMVLLEAMSVGLPVVSFDLQNGPRDLITPGVDGLLVEDRNVEALADALRSLMDDRERRAAMGAAAAENVKRFGRGNIAERWEQLFTELLAAKAASTERRDRP